MRIVAVLLALAACTPATSAPDAGSVATSPWKLVRDDLPAPLMSAWMSDDGVLYAVGGNRHGPLVVRHDEDGWWSMDPGTREPLWWVTGFSSDDVWAVGENGVVTSFDGTRWTLRRAGGEDTLYGIWGESAESLWAVGGVASTFPQRPLVLRRDGDGWREELLGLPTDQVIFKIWGQGAHLRIVGDEGLAARWDPASRSWLREGTTVSERLVTIFGRDLDTTYAVGGDTNPILLRARGSTWTNISPADGAQPLLGGTVSWPDRATLPGVVAVGWGGAIFELGVKGLVARSPVSKDDLHAVTPTPTGFVAVGGDLFGTLERGAIVARGALEAGAIREWPHAPDDRSEAGVEAPDAGVDGGSEDGGRIAAGEECGEELPRCVADHDCWWYVDSQEFVCSRDCAEPSECPDFGLGACCFTPGPQTTRMVCMRAGQGACPRRNLP